MEDDGRVIEEAKDMHAEGVDHTVRNKDSGIDSDRLTRSGDVGSVQRGCGRDEAGETKRDTGCDGNLAEQIEPA